MPTTVAVGTMSASISNNQSSGCAATGVAGLRAFRNGVFGAFYVLSKKIRGQSKAVRLLGQTITLLQLLSFLNAPNTRWSSLPSLQWLHWISNLLSVQGFSFLNNHVTYLVVFYAAMAWTAAFCGLFIATMAMFISGSFPVLWPLKVLRLIAGVTVDQLYIPLLSSLLTQFLCTSNPFWTQSGYTCFQGGHLAQTPIVVILIILLVLLCSGFALLFYDAAILSRSYSARVHGRLDFANLIIKTVLTVFVKTFPFATTSWGVIALLLIAGVLLFALALYLQPYIHHASNRMDAAVAACFFYGSFCVLLGQLFPLLDAGVLLLVGLPLAAAFGVFAADLRAQSVFFKPVSDLSSPIEFEQKCRYLLHEALFGHYVKELHALGEEPPSYRYAPGSDAAGTALVSPQRKPNEDDDPTAIVTASTGSSASRVVGAMKSPPPEMVAKTRQEMEQRLSDPDDTDALLETARQFLSPVDIARIEGVYKAGVKRFKMDGLLHIALARWYLDMRKNKHLFMSSLLQAERGIGPLDVDVGFIVFNARKKREDSSGSQGSMSAMLRVSFEKHLADARKSVIRAASAQLAFWSELLAPLPDLGRLHKASSDMADAETQAEQAFSQLLELSPQSLLVLRMYSEFQLKIRNNPEKAALLTAEAERIEESAAKEHSKDSSSSLKIMEQSPLDVMSDSVGLIQISGNPHTLGIITSVNTVAAKMLGYAKWQLLRRNINVIIPEPFAAWHDHFLRRFLASGEGNVLDYTRCLLAIHRNGHAFPVLLCVREVPTDQTNGGAAEFVGLMRPVTMPEQHMMLDADFKITAATAGSLQALDLEPSSLQQDVSLRDFIPELDRIMDELLSPKGAIIALDAQHAKAAAAARISAANNASSGQGQGRGQEQDLLGSLLARRNSSSYMGATGRSFRVPSKNNRHTPRGASSSGDTDNEGGKGPYDDGADKGGELVWARAQLQKVQLRSGLSVYIFYWQKLFLDPVAMAQAEFRRAEMLQRISGGPATVQKQPQPASLKRLASVPHFMRKGRGSQSSSRYTASSSILDSAGSEAGDRHIPRKATLADGIASKEARSHRGRRYRYAADEDHVSESDREGSSKSSLLRGGSPSAHSSPGHHSAVASLVEAKMMKSTLLSKLPMLAEPIRPMRAAFKPSSDSRESSDPSTVVRTGRNVSAAQPAGADGPALQKQAPATDGTPAWVAPLLPSGHPPLPPGIVTSEMSHQQAFGRCPALLRTNIFAGEAEVARPGTSGSVYAASSSRVGVMLSVPARPPAINTSVEGKDEAPEVDGVEQSPPSAVSMAPAPSSDLPISASQGLPQPPSTGRLISAAAVATAAAAAAEPAHSPPSSLRQLSVRRPEGSPNPNSSPSGSPTSPTSILRRGSMSDYVKKAGQQLTINLQHYSSSDDVAGSDGSSLYWTEKATGLALTPANGNPSGSSSAEAPAESPMKQPPADTPRAHSKRGSVAAHSQDDGDSRSNGSANSRMTAVKRLLTRLRRQLNDGDQSELLPALKWLRVASLGIWVLAVVLAVAVVAVGVTAIEGYADNLVVASRSGHIIESSQRLGFAVREMTLINQGWIVPPNQYIPLSSPLATPALISMVNDFTGGAVNNTAGGIYGSTLIVPGWLNLWGELVSQTARFSGILDYLYSYALATGAEDVYTAVDVPIYSYVPDPVTGALDQVTSVVSLREACLQLVAEAKTVASLPASAVTAANPAVSFLLAHSLRSSPLQIALNATMFDFAAQSSESKGAVILTLTGIYSALSVLLLLCAVFCFAPILYLVDSSKNLVVRRFTHLPRKVLEKLREGAEVQVRRLTDDDDDEDGANESEDDADSQSGGNAKANGFAAIMVDSKEEGAVAGDVEGAELYRPSSQGQLRVPTRSNSNQGSLLLMQQQQERDRTSASDPVEGEDWEALFRQNSGRKGKTGGGGGTYDMASVRRPSHYSPAQVAPVPTPTVPGQSPNGKPGLRVGSKASVSSFGASSTDSSNAMLYGGGSGDQPRFTKSLRPLLVLMLKYVAPLLAIWAFFSLLYFTSRATLDVTTATSSIALASSTRGILTGALAAQIREAVSTPGSPADVEQLISGVVQTSIDLAYFHRLLAIGGVPASAELAAASREAASNGASGLSSTELSEVNALQFGDACSEMWSWDSEEFPTAPAVTVETLNLPSDTVAAQSYAGSPAFPGANITECSQLLKGAISRGGLNSGIQQLLRVASGFVARRAAAITAPSAAFDIGNMTTLFSSPQLPVALGIPPPAWVASNQYARSGPDGISYGGFVVINPATGELEWAYEVRSWNGTALSWSTTWEPYSLSFELSSPGMWAVKEAGTKYLTSASYQISQAFTDSGIAAIRVQVVFQISFAATFLVVYLLFLLLVVLPSIRKESDLIKKQRGLMLLLPPPVLRLSRDLRSLLVAIVSNGGIGAISTFSSLSLSNSNGSSSGNESSVPQGGNASGSEIDGLGKS